MDAVFTAGFALSSFLTMIVTLFLSVSFLGQYRYLDLKYTLGPQLMQLALKIPFLNLPVWMAVLSAGVMLSLFCARQKRRFRHREFGHEENRAS